MATATGTEVGVGFVTLLPSARGFRRNLEREISGDVTAAGSTAGTRFGRSFSTSTGRSIRSGLSSSLSAVRTFASSAVKNLARVSVAAGAVAGGFGLLGLKTAANLQTAQIGFATLLGSAKRASAFLTDVRNFAVRTPFEVEGLIGNARALLGVGIRAKAVLPTLTALGDATAALGLNQDQFNGVLRAYTQIASKGKVQAEELLQIAENGIPAVQLFAKSLGLSVPQLQQLTKEGKLTSDVALPALLAQLNKDYGGSMNRQFSTLNGLFANFKETVKLALADGVQPLVPMLQNVLPTATAAFGRGIKAASGALAGFIRGFQGAQFDDGKVSAFENIGSAAKTAFERIKAGVRAAIPVLRAIWEFISTKLFPALQAAARDALPDFQRAFKSISDTIRNNKQTFINLGRLLVEVVIPILGKVAGFLANTLGPAFRGIVAILRFVVIPIVALMAKAWLTAMQLILNGAAKAFGWLPKIGGKLKNAASSFNDFAAGVNASLSAITNDVFVTVHVRTDDIGAGFTGENLTPQQAAAQNRKNQIAERAKRSAKEAAEKAKKASTDAFGNLGALMGDSIADGLGKKAGKAKKAAQDAVKKAADAAKQALQDARRELRDYAKSVRESIQSFGNLTDIGSIGAAATPNSLKNFLTRQLEQIKAFRKNLQALAKRGISDSLLKKIADAGVEQGGPVAAALARADDSQFGTLTKLDAQINRNAGSVGSLVAGRLFGDKVAAAGARVENLTVIVNNPVRERASTTAPKAVRRALLAAG